jgi:hypothetical protein
MMVWLLLAGSMLFAAAPGPKNNNAKQDLTKTTTTLSQDVEAPSTTPPPQYKTDTIEYKIQQVALNIESVLPSKIINPDYKEAYLDTAGVPKLMRDNFTSRNAIYNDIIKIKIMEKVKELPSGLLESNATASTEENDKLKIENNLRAELFALIVKHLNIKSEQEKKKVPTVYAEAIKYLKDYSLTIPAPAAQKKETQVITSITSIYKQDAVWDTLLKVLKDENYIIDKNAIDKSKGSINVKYNCTQEERTFVMRLCAIKESKLYKCKDATDSDLYVAVPEGVKVWVEKGKDKEKSLIVMENTTVGDQSVKLCKDDVRVFDILEKLSGSLIEADNAKKEKTEKKAKD